MSVPFIAPDGINQPITAVEASCYFDVTPSTIRKWDQLGKIKPVGIDARGRNLYRLIDISDCEKSTRVSSGREKRLQKLA